jgi:hypothetical protein
MRRVALVALVALAAFAVTPLDAQVIELGAGAATVQNHLRFASSVSEQTGQWLGADGALRFGSLRVGASGSIGSLAGTADGVVPDRTGRTTALTVQYAPNSWLAAGASLEAKRFDSDLGSTVWRLIGANVQLTPSLGGPVQGLAEVTLWPMASVINGASISLALRSTFGATYWFSGGRFGARLAYRFERFDFEGQGGAAGEERLEQFRGATIGAVYRLNR